MNKKGPQLLLSMLALLVIVLLTLGCEEGARYPAQMVCQTDLMILKKHIEQYDSVVGHPPSEEDGLGVFVHPPRDPDGHLKWRIQLYEALPLDPWHRPFVYRFPGRRNPGSFDLFSLGPDGVESDDDIYPAPESE